MYPKKLKLFGINLTNELVNNSCCIKKVLLLTQKFKFESIKKCFIMC